MNKTQISHIEHLDDSYLIVIRLLFGGGEATVLKSSSCSLLF